MSQRGEGFDCEERALVRCVTASAYCEAASAVWPLVASVLDILVLGVVPVGLCVVVVGLLGVLVVGIRQMKCWRRREKGQPCRAAFEPTVTCYYPARF